MSAVLTNDYAELASRLADVLERLEGAHVVVTGAAGFIGRYLAGFMSHLNADVLVRPLTADLLDNFIVKEPACSRAGGSLQLRYSDVSKVVRTTAAPDYIIHAAGIASPKYYSRFPAKTIECGTTGTRRMLDLARKARCRGMLYFSSSEVYGDPDPANVPTKETYNGNVSTSGPRACYDESKRMGETWSFLYAQKYGVPVKVVRPFNIYGPGFGRGDGRVVPSFIRDGMARRPITVHGRGEQTRTLCYLADAIEAIIRVLLSPSVGEAFNIGADGPELSVAELAATVADLIPGGASVVHRQPELAAYSCGNPARRCPDITKLVARTGFRPTRTLRAGLQRTITWYVEAYGVEHSIDLRRPEFA